MPSIPTYLVLLLWGLLLLAVVLQYGGLAQSLRVLRGRGMKVVLIVSGLALLGAAAYRATAYLTPEREAWIAVGRLPADTVSLGFNTKSRFRGLAQPLGRVTDRNGSLLAGYRYRNHLMRSYPAGPATAHIVGYWTGPLRDGMGVEKALVMINDSVRDGRPHDMRLTLDLRLQRDAMRALGGRMGAIVVMDASSGEVLAAANYPTFVPDSVWSDDAWNRYVRDTKNRPLTSRAIKDNFSPGSSIKPFIAAAALHLRTPLPESEGFSCAGTYTPVPGTKPITEHGSAHGAVDLESAMRYSCNIYFSLLAHEIGFDAVQGYLGSLGFDRRMAWNGGAYLNEYGTLLPMVSWVKGRDAIARSRIGIGQASVKTNPLHMAALMAGIANRGTFMRPMLELGRRPERMDWSMDRATADRLEELLRGPLLAGGTAAGAFSGIGALGITVYGKTGTADREPDGREPSWFISYGKKSGRAFAVVVAIQDRDGRYAGELNAPMARRMYEALNRFGYYR